jgi:uncharacterized protein
MNAALPFRSVAAGLELRVRLTPKSSRDQVEGIEQTAEGPAVKARVRAVPEDGKANAALEVVVAEWLHVPKRSVSVTSGSKSRVKTVTITGVSNELVAKIDAALAAGGRNS